MLRNWKDRRRQNLHWKRENENSMYGWTDIRHQRSCISSLLMYPSFLRWSRTVGWWMFNVSAISSVVLRWCESVNVNPLFCHQHWLAFLTEKCRWEQCYWHGISKTIFGTNVFVRHCHHKVYATFHKLDTSSSFYRSKINEISSTFDILMWLYFFGYLYKYFFCATLQKHI